MAGSAHESDRILAQARQSLVSQRAGGRRLGSIGQQSARLKRGHLMKKLGRVALAVGAVWLAATVAGLVIDGIGWTGIILAIVASAVAVGLFSRYPRLEMPRLEALKTADAARLVGQTELWLERQRPALPPPAVKLVNHIGLQLDALGLQLKDVDPLHPAVSEVRKLVGEHLPGVVEGYRKIPEHLRYEDRGGTSADRQFMDSLQLISGEIDSVTRQLASGALDDLAIKTRFLDYKYGGAIEGEGPSGA